MFTQLLYISRRKNPNTDITKFIEKNRENNKQSDITSILLSTDAHFIQLIEGNRFEVNALYGRIIKDSHHYDCTLLRYVDVKKQEFQNFHASYVSIDEFKIGDMNLLLPAGDVNLDTITSTKAVSMIRRIHAHLQIRNTDSLK